MSRHSKKRQTLGWSLLLLLGFFALQMERGDVGEAVDASPAQPASDAREQPQFIYTKHARERMAQRGANDNEVEDTILNGMEVPAKGDKQKFEKVYDTACEYQGRQYDQKQVEVVTAKDDDDWVIVTVIADCK